MKYIKTFEMAAYTFEADIEDWDNQKKYMNRDTVSTIDNYIKYVRVLYGHLSDPEIVGQDRREVVKKFKSSHGKLKTLIRNAKQDLDIIFKVGQVFKISDMYKFNYNTYHNTLRSEDDRCLDLEEYGMGRIWAYSDITISNISPSGKSITVEFYGVDYRSSFNYNKRQLKLKFSYNKMKEFFFNLVNDDDYKKLLYGKYIKKINENKYNKNIQSELDNILDKINDNGFDSLSLKERDFIKSFNKGTEKESYQEFIKKEYEDGIFKFKLDNIKDVGNGDREFHGTLTIDDVKFNGYILYKSIGVSSPHFDDENGLTIWDHVEDFEYYLDDFIDYIISDNE